MLFATLLISSCWITAFASIPEFIGDSSKKKFYAKLTKGCQDPIKTDFSSSYYASNSFAQLGEEIPAALKSDSCRHLDANFNNVQSSESVFHALSTWSILNCASVLSKKDKKLYNADSIKALKAKLESQEASIADIRYAMEALQLVGETFPNPTKIAQLLQKRLKSDDSLLTLGHTLHAGAMLGVAGKFVVQYVEDILVQTDEIEGRLLQWEGGLSVTGLLLTGLFRLPEGEQSLTQTQVDKFTTYLLSRKDVPALKGIYILIESLIAISKSKLAPISVTFVESAQVKVDKPELKIRIADMFGKPLAVPPTSVLAQSATRVVDDVVVLSKQALTPGKDKSEYILDLKLSPGQYRVALAIGNEESVSVLAQVLGSISLQWLEAGLGDSDGSTAPHLTKLQHPAKLATTLKADASQHLLVRFVVSQAVHQAFLRLSTENREIIFVAEQDSNKVYKVDVNVATKLSSGTFDLELILGDSVISNPIRWQFGSIQVNLPSEEVKNPIVRGLLPEIIHQFRQAEKRPPPTVSTLFTGLAAAPLLLLFILWFKLGINFSNFTLNGLPFHIGLGSIFSLFGLFWLKLDMFTTCGWLIPIAAFTFLTGHHILSKLATRKN